MENLFKPFIFVEAIIGAGKTTFSREIAKRLNLRIIEEPVSDNPYLELFYKDPKQYAFGMQIYLLHRRYAMHQLAAYEALGFSGYNGCISDRSLPGDRVFAKLHMQEGNISEIDFKTYELATTIMCRSLVPPTLIIYLDVQPETAFNRMKKRNRGAEAGVPLEYLVKLRNGYVDLIHEAEKGLLPWTTATKVCRIPWDFDIHDDSEWDSIALTVKDACRTIG